MKKYLLCLPLFIYTIIYGQNSILWEITGPKIKPSYLMGTMHVGDQRILNLNDSVHICMQKSKVLALELNLDQSLKPGQMIKLLSMIKLPQDTSYSDLLNSDDLAYLHQNLERQLISPFNQIWTQLKPSFVGLLMMQSDSNIAQNSDTPPLDLYLHELSKKYKLKHTGLELLTDQIRVLDALPLKTQAQLLIEELKDSTPLNVYDKLLELYLDQDIESLKKLIEENELNDHFKNNIIGNRNITMTSQLIQLAKKKRTFVAVGAGHLGGEDGIISLLREKGFNVRAVYAPFNN